MLPDESPETSFTLPPTPITPISLGWSPSYPSQYIPPVVAPPYWVTMEPPLTEERFRHILREELAAYFDEGHDVLSAPLSSEDDTQS